MKLITKQSKVKYGIWRAVGRTILLMLLIVLIPVSYVLPQILIRGEAAEFYSRNVFPWVSMLAAAVNGMFLFSLTEMFVVVGSVTLAVLIVMFLIKCIKLMCTRDTRSLIHYVYVVLRNVAIIGIAAALCFELMHGLNYNRMSVRKSMTLYGDTRSYEDYAETLLWAYSGMVNARSSLGEDYYGVAHMNTAFEVTVYDANVAVSSVGQHFDLGISPNYIRAKAVWLSRLWGYTDIVGVYDPFLGESNINTDYIDVLHFPVTVCHEITHARGYASETDANTIAILSCINSPRADFRYAGYYYIFMHLWNTVNDYADYEGVAMTDYFSRNDFKPVMRDINAYNEYRESFNTGPIADLISRFSEDVNNAFLESNGQEGGTDTYVVPQDAYVEYYCRYVRADA